MATGRLAGSGLVGGGARHGRQRNRVRRRASVQGDGTAAHGVACDRVQADSSDSVPVFRDGSSPGARLATYVDTPSAPPSASGHSGEDPGRIGGHARMTLAPAQRARLRRDVGLFAGAVAISSTAPTR